MGEKRTGDGMDIMACVRFAIPPFAKGAKGGAPGRLWRFEGNASNGNYSGICQPPEDWARVVLAVTWPVVARAISGKAAWISGARAQTGTSFMV
jgi:hypothetical protein